MKKDISEILTDGLIPTEELITDEMISVSSEGMDIERVTAMTLEKTGAVPKKGFFRRYYKQFSAVAACFVLFVGMLVAYRLGGGGQFDPPAVGGKETTGDASNGSGLQKPSVDGVIWGDETDDGRFDYSEGDQSPEDEASPKPESPVESDTEAPSEYDPEGGCSPETTDSNLDDPGLNPPANDDLDRYVFSDWNGMSVQNSLIDAFYNGGEDAIYAVRVENRPLILPDDYVFEGKTVGEWWKQNELLSDKLNLINEAYKYGFGLVYGEESYGKHADTVTAIFGESWNKEMYEKYISQYGAVFGELYAEYEAYLKSEGLWGDEYLTGDIGYYWKDVEKLADAMYEKCKSELDEISDICYKADRQYYLENTVSLAPDSDFERAAGTLGIKVYSSDRYAYIFVTEDELIELGGLIDTSKLCFRPASKSEFEYYFDYDGNKIEQETSSADTGAVYGDNTLRGDSTEPTETELPDDRWGTEKELYGTGYDTYETDLPVPDTEMMTETDLTYEEETEM